MIYSLRRKEVTGKMTKPSENNRPGILKRPLDYWLKLLAVILLIFVLIWAVSRTLLVIKSVLLFSAGMLSPFLIAVVLAYVLHPLVNMLHRQGMPRILAILIIYLLFLGAGIFLIVNGGPRVVEQVQMLKDKMPKLIKLYEAHVNRFYTATSDFPESVHDNFRHLLATGENAINRFIKNIAGGIRQLFASIFNILLIPFLVFYLLKDGDHIQDGIMQLIPESWKGETLNLGREIDKELGSYIRGQLFVCLVLGILGFIGLWIMKVPYPALLAFLIGITDLIPFFGPLIGAVPAVFIGLTVSVKTTIFIVLLITVLQMLEGNVISPLIVGKSVHLHPLYIMIALIIGGELWGILGLLFAVPALVVIKVIIRHLLTLRKKKIDKSVSSQL